MKKELLMLFACYIGFILIGILIGFDLSEKNRYDVNRDGKVNAVDYVQIKNYIMKKGE